MLIGSKARALGVVFKISNHQSPAKMKDSCDFYDGWEFGTWLIALHFFLRADPFLESINTTILFLYSDMLTDQLSFGTHPQVSHTSKLFCLSELD